MNQIIIIIKQILCVKFNSNKVLSQILDPWITSSETATSGVVCASRVVVQVFYFIPSSFCSSRLWVSRLGLCGHFWSQTQRKWIFSDVISRSLLPSFSLFQRLAFFLLISLVGLFQTSPTLWPPFILLTFLCFLFYFLSLLPASSLPLQLHRLQSLL